VPIGYPARNTQVYVVDEHGRVVPDTIPGELLIVGQGLARGYLNRPDLTVEKFIDFSPGDSSPMSKAYLTGDRGRWNARGQLEFLGRTDDQIKLNGYRIELGEIEAALQAHPAVDRAAVKLAQRREASSMVAFVSLLKEDQPNDSDAAAESAAITGAAIRRDLLERLPAYKLPSTVKVLDKLPLTAGGKIDKARLPDVAPEESTHFLAPDTELEKFVARAWCEVLGLEKVSVDQNFFEAGGNSLQAAVVTSRLSQELGVHVPTALIFDLADIAHVAQRLIELYPEAMSIRFGAELAVPNSNANSHPLLATFKAGSSSQPLFMVHPPGGIVACYRELALHLDQNQQLVALRSRGLHSAEDLPADLAAMASEYVAAVRTLQPSGPYLLGGWSLGGLVAYEMARQLQQEGEVVSRMFLLDTAIPAGATELVVSDASQVGLEYGIDLTLEELSQLAPEEQLPFLWEHAKKLGVLQDDSPPEVVQSVLSDLQDLFHHHVELCSHYKLAPLDVPISLYRPLDIPVQAADATAGEPEDRGWSKLSPYVEVHFVPGHHHSMVQMPHVAELAKLMASQLQTMSESTSW
jgi:thioesterase domain-containing protein